MLLVWSLIFGVFDHLWIAHCCYTTNTTNIAILL